MADAMKLVPVEPTEAMLHVGSDAMMADNAAVGDAYRAMLAAAPPAVEGGASLDVLADWLSLRVSQSADAAQQHSDKAPAKHFCAGKAAAFRELASVLWNSPEWFACPPAREEAPDEGAGLYNQGFSDGIAAQALRASNRTSEPEAGMTVIDPDQWEPCSPSWVERHPTGCGQAPRVWCEAESNHYHPLNWKASEPEAGAVVVKAICQHCQRATVVPPETLALALAHPAPATADKLRELIEAAYIAGATNVHEYWCDNPGEAPASRDDPEFDEAASDYAFAALNEHPQ